MLLHAITSVVAGTPLRYHFSLCLVFTPVINNNDNKRIQVVQYVSSKIPAAAPNCTVTWLVSFSWIILFIENDIQSSQSLKLD